MSPLKHEMFQDLILTLCAFCQAQAQVCIWEERVLEGIEDNLADMVSAAQDCAEVWLI